MTPSPNAVVRVPQGGTRVKSYTPLIVPGHYYHQQQKQCYSDSPRTKKPGGMMEKPEKSSSSTSAAVVGAMNGQDFYAGAKFDLSPEVASLPTPPPTWVIPLVRSQSQPNSPVTTTTTGTRIDVNSLFFSPKVIKKASSTPVASLPAPPPTWVIPLVRSQSQPNSPVTTTTTGIRIDVNSLFFSPEVIKASSFSDNEMDHGSSYTGGRNNNHYERKSPKKPATENMFSEKRRRMAQMTQGLRNQKLTTVQY